MIKRDRQSALFGLSALSKTLHVEHLRGVVENVNGTGVTILVARVSQFIFSLIADGVQDGDEKTFECSCDAHAISKSARYAPINPITGAHFTRRLDIHTVSYRTKLEQPIAYVIDFS